MGEHPVPPGAGTAGDGEPSTRHDCGPGDDLSDHADRALAELGAELASLITAAVPAWVERCVEGVLEAWRAGGEPAVDLTRQRAVAASGAADEVGRTLRLELSADVDAQSVTPLQVVRRAVRYPTAVLREAGIPPLTRDRYAEERFPDDPYDLTPGSLGALDPALADIAAAWGAAKAMAHRRRHGDDQR